MSIKSENNPNKTEFLLSNDDDDDEIVDKKIWPKKDIFQKTNDSFHYPLWNPSNDPNNISCSDAFKVHLFCAIYSTLASQRERYNDSRLLPCSRTRSDLNLCLQVKTIRDFEKRRKTLETAYPWVCDRTQGFRHRHVWKFRKRPPTQFDDSRISEKEYAVMRESSITIVLGSLISRIYFHFVPHKIYEALDMSTKDFAEHVMKNRDKNKPKKYDFANRENVKINEAAQILTEPLLTEKEKSQNRSLSKSRILNEKSDLVAALTDIVENSGNVEYEKKRKKEYSESTKNLFGEEMSKSQLLKERENIENIVKMEKQEKPNLDKFKFLSDFWSNFGQKQKVKREKFEDEYKIDLRLDEGKIDDFENDKNF
ncbi:hypothetical protein MHBO_000851 [Bonamia ostreae]|uniref:Uncharacterized protein n=1 Tax=Bonamia ostreae TaxID=126728 RepID=A0ABV2AHW5_9EUKA